MHSHFLGRVPHALSWLLVFAFSMIYPLEVEWQNLEPGQTLALPSASQRVNS